MKEIIKKTGSIYGSKDAWSRFHKHISLLNPSKIFILTDTNTKKYCLPYFEKQSSLSNAEILTISAGEKAKNIQTCVKVWESLSQLGADRKSLLINLGGGVVTDLGGFVACTYQRGIQFMNIPTSLLSMVDASVGGKNGVDLGHLKNQIGLIKNPDVVIIDTHFLKTLPTAEIYSGQAEMIKHGFIHSEDYLNQSFLLPIEDHTKMTDLIWKSVEIKNQIIEQDPNEVSLRKVLNYGHTLGHAIESYCLESKTKKTLLHGEAIAIGMILATYLSVELFDFPKDKLNHYTKHILSIFPKYQFSQEDIEQIIKLLRFDKKNSHGKVQFVLLSAIGIHHVNCVVSEKLIYHSFKFYQLFSAD
jgi:3-dehydroquinate synthase